jgi:glycosyltransferase involved in cell wall biosynthesis
MPFECEVIVADDCSNDSTQFIVKDKLLGVFSNLRILDSPKNLGISKNYKRGFAECTGEYVAVIEGDDYWTSPDRLFKHVNFLDGHRECVMSMNRYIEYAENSNLFSHGGWNFQENYRYVTTQEMALGNKLGNLSACVFRKSEIDKIKPNLYDLEIADWILGMVLSQNGYISILKELMSVRRVHDKGEWSKMSIQKRNESIVNYIDIYNKYLDFKYDKEFSVYKKRLYESTNSKKTNIIDFIPPIFIHLVKLLFPKILIKFLRKLF